MKKPKTYKYEFDRKEHLKRMKEHYSENRKEKLAYAKLYYNQEKIIANDFIKENKEFIETHIEKRPSKVVKLVESFTDVVTLKDRIRTYLNKQYNINLEELKMKRNRKSK